MAQQLPLDELSTVIARIQGLLLTEEKVNTAVRLLAQAAKESVPGTIGAGVSLMDARGRRISSGYTDRIVAQTDAMQYECGEGPCLTAWATEKPVLLEDIREESRWPDWRRAVQGLPVRSVVSAPLIAGKESIGALKLYAGPRILLTSPAPLCFNFLRPLPPRCSRTFRRARHPTK
jgi:GAF domain-containing protein